jgi:hypothetical protein
MTCWTGTGDSYGYLGLAFTSTDEVWARDSGPTRLRRLDFPAMTTVAQTIDPTTLTSIATLGEGGVMCVDQDPLIIGDNDDGDNVLVNASLDTVLHNFGPTISTGLNFVIGVYNPFEDKLYLLSYGVGLESYLYRLDPDGTNLTEVWHSVTEDPVRSLLCTSDGGVWWAVLQDIVYRVSISAGVDSLPITFGESITHDPTDGSRVVTSGERYSWSAGTITADTPGCFASSPDWPAIRHNGTAGIVATSSTVQYWIAEPTPPSYVDPGPSSVRVHGYGHR